MAAEVERQSHETESTLITILTAHSFDKFTWSGTIDSTILTIVKCLESKVKLSQIANWLKNDKMIDLRLGKLSKFGLPIQLVGKITYVLKLITKRQRQMVQLALLYTVEALIEFGDDYQTRQKMSAKSKKSMDRLIGTVIRYVNLTFPRLWNNKSGAIPLEPSYSTTGDDPISAEIWRTLNRRFREG